MQCHQIQPLLCEYASGSLPAYKSAWVAQHLAACGDCQVQAERARHQHRLAAPEAAAASAGRPAGATPPPPALLRRGEVSVAIQRPVPAWLRLTAVLLLAAVAAGAAWVLVARARAPVQPIRYVRPVVAPPPVEHPWYENEADLSPYWPDATVGPTGKRR
jgi:anti-sigma factor RsiW